MAPGVVVLYASETGNAASIAEDLQRGCERRGIASALGALNDWKALELDAPGADDCCDSFRGEVFSMNKIIVGTAHAACWQTQQPGPVIELRHDIRLLIEQFATTIDGPQSPHRRAEAIAL